MTPTTDHDATLRSLDPARLPAQGATGRAKADLARILASDPAAPAVRPAPRRTVRLVLAAAAVSAVGLGLVLVPGLRGGDAAFATWEAAPRGLSHAERAEAAESCRQQHEDGMAGDLPASTRVAVADRRGVWTTVVLAGDDGFSALCVTDSSAGWFSRGMIGSAGTPAGTTEPGPRELLATDLGVGSMSASEISLAAGAAGADVRTVTYDSPTYGKVEASVAEGRFAFWMPGDDLAAADGETLAVPVRVTYVDGSSAAVRLSLD